MGPVRQSSPQLHYEAAYENVNNTMTYNPEVPCNLPSAIETPEEVPLLLDDSDSDDEDGLQQSNSPGEELVPQFGNDNCIENDPIPINSARQIESHKPKPPP